MGAEWALNNQTYIYMNGWFHYAKLYAALDGTSSKWATLPTLYADGTTRTLLPAMSSRL